MGSRGRSVGQGDYTPKVEAMQAMRATTAFGQAVFIGLPQQGASLTPGENITVQIKQLDSLSSLVNVAIVIGLQPCSNGICYSPDETLPELLYYGPFNPQFEEEGPPPYQNFTVQVPSDVPSGPAIIGIEFFGLVGAVRYLFTDIVNQTVTVV